jgi:formylglycine-generating enzyme
MRARRATAPIVFTAVLGAFAACSTVLGITPFTGGDGGARDATSPDGAGREGEGSAPCTPLGDAATAASGLGCPCAPEGELGCNGNAQAETLTCSQGLWTHRSTCATGQNCDSRIGGAQGTCAAIDPTCASAAPDQAICSNATTAVQCGPDRVSETPLATCMNQACFAGVCGGVCIPGSTQCAGNGLQTCGTDGQWKPTMACSESCSDGGCGFFPSCAGGGAGAQNDCGASDGDAGTNDCCASFEVPGGMFDRGYDGVSPGDTSMASPATVSGFRLDQYEVTVGRFRKFVNAVVGGYDPAPGDGKHTHLNGGSGLTSVGTDAGATEPGWSMSWDSKLTSSQTTWNTDLSCPGGTWTNAAGADEHQPISCVTWYEAYAFCIWDGGFLPSEAEWNYAASGGGDQRVYPWSSPPMSTTIDCGHANYTPIMGMAGCSATGTNDVGSESTTGDGKYGQADLAGNVWEWTLDSSAPYVTPCIDCSNVAPLASRVTRGGGYNVVPSALVTSYRSPQAIETRDNSVGFRCARGP